MSETELCDEALFRLGEKASGTTYVGPKSSKQQLNGKFDEEFSCKKNARDGSYCTGNWCEAVSSSISSATGKQAWKNGTGKLSQTFNNVRTTIGILSQKMKKSTKKRQTLINIESPSSPDSPCSKSRAALGRTPTKLYSPFSIDTPTGKENQSNRYIRNQTQVNNSNGKGERRKFRRTKLDLGVKFGETSDNVGEAVFSNDLMQTQIGIYEFHTVANRIVQRNLNN